VQILPSDREPLPPGDGALTLTPFRGVRYALDRVSGLAEVTSPPYDVVARDIADRLLEADPHNVVRLILPRPTPGQRGGAYRDAARTLRDWLVTGILSPDGQPALYVYEQAAAADGQAPAVLQRGLIGALRLTPLDGSVVHPHEDVAPGPVADRLQLMEATQANLEPILLLHSVQEQPDQPGQAGQSGRAGRDVPGAQVVSGTASRVVEETADAGGQPLAEAVTSDGIRHRLWAVTDRADLAGIAADLAPRTALIADGHHRYSAYLELQSRLRTAGAGPGPWDYGLALLVDASAYPPDIGAIHRVIPRLDPATAVRQAAGAFTVRSLPGGTGQLPAALASLAEASAHGPALIVAGGGRATLLTDPDPAQLDAAMPAGHSPRWRALAASVLQELLLGRIWKTGDGEDDVKIVHHDAAEAVRQADETGGTAVICPPMLAQDVYAVAERGERVPRKSTSFGPKPRTGLVIRAFAEG
jgi:uncharacterized protein (DUF1015 family)